ncbi:hypothetical protein GCM10012275_25090 [Longimycelium tulufanense]|uniref:Insertion element protein n=1 Tax=Longimycelium tulufanense TaxID=907463 RepID=A0A8J3C814_9PSEU|nr:hypothetical protein [Longimycelium tulufanense]GGM53089.1 hypothetical protein GCM10012275_25090 [Longimycelium tulufanense]
MSDSGASPEGRATPFYCPYCGDEDLRPVPPEELDAGRDSGKPRGGWLCGACRRVFAVRMLGLVLGRTGSDDQIVEKKNSPRAEVSG